MRRPGRACGTAGAAAVLGGPPAQQAGPPASADTAAWGRAGAEAGAEGPSTDRGRGRSRGRGGRPERGAGRRGAGATAGAAQPSSTARTTPSRLQTWRGRDKVGCLSFVRPTDSSRNGTGPPDKCVRHPEGPGEILDQVCLLPSPPCRRFSVRSSLRDAHRLGRRLEGARRIRKPEARQAVLDEIAAEADQGRARDWPARALADARRSRIPSSCPSARRRTRSLEAIRDHQVVIVAGETGSGKTTQIPKICLELGRGVRGMIGHTQPRRIAARTVAERVAEELKSPLGQAVGWKVRFTDQVGPGRDLRQADDGRHPARRDPDGPRAARVRHDHHRRGPRAVASTSTSCSATSPQLLPRRPDLKVVITSATIDPERFSRHFGDAPIVEVSGRTYPVEVRYRPLLEEDAEDSATATRSPRSATPWTSSRPRARATSWSSSPASGRSATPPTR